MLRRPCQYGSNEKAVKKYDSAFLLPSPPAKRRCRDATLCTVHFGGQGRGFEGLFLGTIYANLW